MHRRVLRVGAIELIVGVFVCLFVCLLVALPCIPQATRAQQQAQFGYLPPSLPGPLVPGHPDHDLVSCAALGHLKNVFIH